MKASILVIEDDPSTREVLRRGLSSVGYEVLEASSISAAKILLGDHHVDLVLTDLGLPDGEGTDLADYVQLRRPDTPVLLMTGRLDPPDRDNLLRKPVELPRLLEIVDRLVQIAPAPPPRTVLIVDDDESARELLATRLRREGYEVLQIGDSAQAFRMVLQTRPDAIVSDVVMPFMDGFELCAALRSRQELSGVPIILLTALDVAAPDRNLARSVGASALVRRSPGLDELLLTLASLPSLDTPAPSPKQDHVDRLRDQLHGELQRRQAQEHAGALLAGRLAAVASISEVLARGSQFMLEDTLARLLDAPHLELVALWTPGADESLHLEAFASVLPLAEDEVACFFGRSELVSFHSDDVLISVATPEVLEDAGVASVVLVPLVHQRQPLGVVGFGFDVASINPPAAFLRACQAVLTMELLLGEHAEPS